VKDVGDIKLDQFIDDSPTASNIQNPRANGAANKKVLITGLAIAVCSALMLIFLIDAIISVSLITFSFSSE